MQEYEAHIAEQDFASVWADLKNFLDVDRLEFVLTEETVVVMPGDFSPRADRVAAGLLSCRPGGRLAR